MQQILMWSYVYLYHQISSYQNLLKAIIFLKRSIYTYFLLEKKKEKKQKKAKGKGQKGNRETCIKWRVKTNTSN